MKVSDHFLISTAELLQSHSVNKYTYFVKLFPEKEKYIFQYSVFVW